MGEIYEVHVKILTSVPLQGKTKEEVLAVLKRTLGNYSEYDCSKLKEVLLVREIP